MQMTNAFLLVFSLLFLCSVDGYFEIELSSSPQFIVPFGTSHILVWENVKSRGKFYASPLVCLPRDRTRVIENIFTGHIQLDFQVVLWSEEAHATVHQYLLTHLNGTTYDIDFDGVELMPMELIRLVWMDHQHPLPNYYRLSNTWMVNSYHPTSVTFTIICEDMDKCQALKQELKVRPEIFNGLEMEYVISAHRYRGGPVRRLERVLRKRLRPRCSAENLTSSLTTDFPAQRLQQRIAGLENEAEINKRVLARLERSLEETSSRLEHMSTIMEQMIARENKTRTQSLLHPLSRLIDTVPEYCYKRGSCGVYREVLSHHRNTTLPECKQLCFDNQRCTSFALNMDINLCALNDWYCPVDRVFNLGNNSYYVRTALKPVQWITLKGLSVHGIPTANQICTQLFGDGYLSD